jgi:hypothetical protein
VSNLLLHNKNAKLIDKRQENRGTGQAAFFRFSKAISVRLTPVKAAESELELGCGR